MGKDLLDLRGTQEPLHHGLRGRRRDEQVHVPDRFPATTIAPSDLEMRQLSRGFETLEERSDGGVRLDQPEPPSPGLQVSDPLEDLGLHRFLPPAQGPQPALARGLFQTGEGCDAELVIDLFRTFGSESRDPDHLDHALRYLDGELLEQRELPSLDDLADLPGEILPDPG